MYYTSRPPDGSNASSRKLSTASQLRGRTGRRRAVNSMYRRVTSICLYRIYFNLCNKMKTVLMVAEKPSLAQSIAKIISKGWYGFIICPLLQR